MFATIQTGGKQYRVQEGTKLEVEKIAADKGDVVTFDKVYSVGDGDDIRIGTPLVAGASVEAKVIDQIRGKKIRIIKFKRRKHYMRKAGHRQSLTSVLVTKVSA